MAYQQLRPKYLRNTHERTDFFEDDFLPRIELLKDSVYSPNLCLQIRTLNTSEGRTTDVVVAPSKNPWAHHFFDRKEPDWAMPNVLIDGIGKRKNCLANIGIVDFDMHHKLHEYGRDHAGWFQEWNSRLTETHMLLLIQNLGKIRSMICPEDYKIILKVRNRMEILGLLERRIIYLAEA